MNAPFRQAGAQESGRRVSRPAAICECGDHAWFALTQGYVALVDADMAHLADRYLWQTKIVRTKRYAFRQSHQSVNGETRHWAVTLHQQIMCVPNDWKVDHRDGNGLDCRTRNMRPCTPTENTVNARKRPRSKSGFRGVKQNRGNNRYRASIISSGRVIYLGSFEGPEAAARAYDVAARKHFGEFAVLNFPEAE